MFYQSFLGLFQDYHYITVISYVDYWLNSRAYRHTITCNLFVQCHETQSHSQKIFLGSHSAFEEKVDLLILYMYHSLGAVEQFIIVGPYAYSYILRTLSKL